MKVAIVNDMFLAVECLRRSVTRGGHEVAWIARNGEEAVALAVNARPDLVLMDLYMPVMDGVEATRQIMTTAPCPIVIVTSSVEDHAGRAFEAMGFGALDAVNTPVCGGEFDMVGSYDLLNKINMIERLVKIDDQNLTQFNLNKPKQFSKAAVPLVVIGSSSGGPQALAEILAQLPSDLPAAITIVQHVDAHFAGELASWLDQQSAMRVRTAVQGEMPTVGEVTIAQTNDHLRLDEKGCFAYAEEPKELVYRPSVDVFFESVAANWQGSILGVLLTGMGRDGAQGLLELKKNGVLTIAQDKQSCAVYGMPKAAVDINAAMRVCSLQDIAREILVWQTDKAEVDGEFV